MNPKPCCSVETCCSNCSNSSLDWDDNPTDHTFTVLESGARVCQDCRICHHCKRSPAVVIGRCSNQEYRHREPLCEACRSHCQRIINLRDGIEHLTIEVEALMCGVHAGLLFNLDMTEAATKASQVLNMLAHMRRWLQQLHATDPLWTNPDANPYISRPRCAQCDANLWQHRSKNVSNLCQDCCDRLTAKIA